MADSSAPAKTGRGTYKHLCGTPASECSGSPGILSNGFKGRGMRLHNTASEAFSCCRRYLLSQGYVQRGPREFQPKDGGPIRVLTKQSRFGARMRPGKGGRNMPGGRRTGGCATSA